MKVLFAGGGTGGHIYPAVAIAEELMTCQKDIEILFIGGTRGPEETIFKTSGFPVKTISVEGFPRKISPRYVSFGWKLMEATITSRRIVREFTPSVLVATGGYVAGPPIIAARTMHVPIAIQEQNAFPGLTNRSLARFADLVFLGFKGAVKYLRTNGEIIYTGNPVRKEIGTFERAACANEFGLNPNLKTVLVFGGSQGSHAINHVFSSVVEHIVEKGIQIIWQTGQKEYHLFHEFNRRYPKQVTVFPYFHPMAKVYAVSDVVVARAGAMTVAEITVCGLPAVLIPLPSAAEGHQEYNARTLEHAGAAVMIRQSDLTPQVFEQELMGIILSDERCSAMAQASAGMGQKDSAHTIARILLERYGGN